MCRAEATVSNRRFSARGETPSTQGDIFWETVSISLIRYFLAVAMNQFRLTGDHQEEDGSAGGQK
jgi:hypothetical protein